MTCHVIIQPQAEVDIEAAYLWKRDNKGRTRSKYIGKNLDTS